MADAGLREHWKETIRRWADAQPFVQEVHGFGSRVKGGYSIDSDLDIAVMTSGGDEGERLGNAICLLPTWRRELQALLPVAVHLQAMLEDDAVVASAVRDHGVLIFSRAAPTLAAVPLVEAKSRSRPASLARAAG